MFEKTVKVNILWILFSAEAQTKENYEKDKLGFG